MPSCTPPGSDLHGGPDLVDFCGRTGFPGFSRPLPFGSTASAWSPCSEYHGVQHWPVVFGQVGCCAALITPQFTLFIAATYTPFVAHAGENALNKEFLAAIWIVALIGVVPEARYPGKFEAPHYHALPGIRLSGLFAYDAVFQLAACIHDRFDCCWSILYSVGVIFHLWDRLRFQNAIWHAFVFGAAAFQFFAVFNSVSAAAAAIG